MTAGNNIVAFGGMESSTASSTLKKEYVGLVNQCRESLAETLKRRLDSLFEKLDDSLYELADKSESNIQQERYFDAMRELRKQRNHIEQRFMGEMSQGFDRFWRQGPRVAAAMPGMTASEDDLSLLDSGDLEEDLAISSMISKGNNSFYRELYALETGFSWLFGGHKVDEESNPLAPSVFGNTIQAAIATIELDISIKLVIYKQFEREVINHLAEIYQPITELMVKRGVPLKRKTAPVSHSHGSQPKASPLARSEQVETSQSELIANAPNVAVFKTLQELLGQRRAPVYNESALQVVATSELMAALSSLQQAGGLTQLTESPSRFDLGLTVKGALGASGENAKRRIDQTDEDVIDVITMLFEFILEDPSLPDAMRAMLARLQIPMLKVVILDKTFLSRPDHPARRLLNNLAQAAVGWSDNMSREQDSLYGNIEVVVNRVLREFDEDIGLFDELNDQFGQFMQHEARGAGIAEERATQVTQGKERLDNAKQEVEHAVVRALSKYIDDVPMVVKEILHEGWKGVLLTILLREGDQSDAWIESVELMDKLVWSVQPKATQEERQGLLKSIPALLKGLRSGLEEISFDQHKMAGMFKELQATHVKCLRTSARPKPQSPLVQEPVQQPKAESRGFSLDEELEGGAEITEEIVLESPGYVASNRNETEGDRFTKLADTLEIGTWLQITDEEGEVSRAKLSWRSGVTGVCLLVNRKGIKVAEVSPQALAAWFRGGTATVLEANDTPLMDRAMSAMMNALGSDKVSAD